MRARSEPSCWVPCLRPPTRNARPSTSSRLARIEPTSAARTTSTSPARSAKMQMNSSGQVAERGLQHAGRAGAQPVAELLDAAADQRGQQADRPRPRRRTRRPRSSRRSGRRRRARPGRRRGRGRSGRSGQDRSRGRAGRSRTCAARYRGGLRVGSCPPAPRRFGACTCPRRTPPTGRLRLLRGRRGVRQVHPGAAAARAGCEAQGYAVLLTFEPGDTAVGQELRRIVLEPGDRRAVRTAPRRCSTPPTRPSTSTPSCSRRSTGARS